MRRAERLLTAVEAIGADRILRRWLGGVGAVFVLHRAAPAGTTPLDPDLTVTADVLDHALGVARAEGFEAVSLDEVPDRLRRPGRAPFVAFTFDDGYRDNLTVALPVFRAHGMKFTVYVATGLIDRTASFWWGALARLVESRDRLDLHALGVDATVTAVTWADKQAVFSRLEAWVHEDLEGRSSTLSAWCRDLGVDEQAELDRAMLTWPEVRDLAHDPLVTIGSHTVTHRRLARLDGDTARRELVDARATLEAAVDQPVVHLAYPYGGRAACGAREFALAAEAGYVTATTTRNANLFAANSEHLTAIPRRRLTEGVPDLRTARRAMLGTRWLLGRGPLVVTS
jgi:peptidoglycan/xylan/chitin deacetylase (PgdA/CDA1 family)